MSLSKFYKEQSWLGFHIPNQENFINENMEQELIQFSEKKEEKGKNDHVLTLKDRYNGPLEEDMKSNPSEKKLNEIEI